MAVQAEMQRREQPKSKPRQTYPYSGLISCAKCGKNYRRKTTATGPVWICATFNTRGKKYCASKQIPESTLETITASVTDDISTIQRIVADDGNRLLYHLTDGTVIERTWQDRSRSESWTAEKRAEVSKRRRKA